MSLRVPRLLCAVLALTAAQCSKDTAPPAGSGSGRRPMTEEDAGASPAPQPSPRPDGGAILPEADEELVLPYQGTAQHVTIEIDAQPRVLDVHFSVDTTSSELGEIHDLQNSLQSEVIPRLRERVPSASFGVSRFEDFPLPPFGASMLERSRADEPFTLLTRVTSDDSRVVSAIASLDQPLGSGGDAPEAGAEALWQIATGEGYKLGPDWLILPFSYPPAPGGGEIGGVGFREGALRAVVHVTDAPSHRPEDYEPAFPGTHSLDEAAEALQDIDARLIGIVTACANRSDPLCNTQAYDMTRAELEALAATTDAVVEPTGGKCPHGIDGAELPARAGRCPLVFDVSETGEGLSSALVDAVVSLVDGTRFRVVTGVAEDDPIGFVTRVRPLLPQGVDEPEIADLLPQDDPDGEPDSFVKVPSRADLAFEVTLQNLVIAPSESEQRFRVVVDVRGDGLVIAQRTLRIVIPKGDRLAPVLDAGDDDAGSP